MVSNDFALVVIVDVEELHIDGRIKQRVLNTTSNGARCERIFNLFIKFSTPGAPPYQRTSCQLFKIN